MRVDLQELDENNDSETESLRTWSEKNPYKVSVVLVHNLHNLGISADNACYSERI